MASEVAVKQENGPPAGMNGLQKAAGILMLLGDDFGGHIWSRLDEFEIKTICSQINNMQALKPDDVESLLADFVAQISNRSAINGGMDTVERLLGANIPGDKLKAIMDEIRGPAGRNIWEKLSNIQVDILSAYLKNEHPQTVAVIMSRIRTDHAAKIFQSLPEAFAIEVINRMLFLEPVQHDVIEKLEQTLRIEFMQNVSQSVEQNSFEGMAEIFNQFDRQSEARFMELLEANDAESADKIKELMFTFDDLAMLDASAMQIIVRTSDTKLLATALKGAKDEQKEQFFANMSARAARLLQDDMEAMGPMRLRDVDEAQSALVNAAKDLAARGEIVISTSGGDDELVF